MKTPLPARPSADSWAKFRSGALQLSDGPGGLGAGPFAANLGTTLPIGATEPITIMLDKQIPNGPWHALVTLRSGLVERSLRATISFPARGTSSPPYALVAGFVILLLLVCIFMALSRRAYGARRKGG